MTNQQNLASSDLPSMLLHYDPVSFYSEVRNFSFSEDCIPCSFMVRSHRAECAATRLTVLYLSCLYEFVEKMMQGAPMDELVVPGLMTPVGSQPHTSTILQESSVVHQALAGSTKGDALNAPFCGTRALGHPENSETHPENKPPKPTQMSCTFKRQIKLFEKLMAYSQESKHLQRQSHAYEQWIEEEKPTFFFGAFARAQLVNPIEGDSHFENSEDGIMYFSNKKMQETGN